MRDEELYPSASTFNPNRFMKDGKLAADVTDPREMFFGFGRRYCFFANILTRALCLISPVENVPEERSPTRRSSFV